MIKLIEMIGLTENNALVMMLDAGFLILVAKAEHYCCHSCEGGKQRSTKAISWQTREKVFNVQTKTIFKNSKYKQQ